jgi:hypothetical protein
LIKPAKGYIGKAGLRRDAMPEEKETKPVSNPEIRPGKPDPSVKKKGK